MADLLSTSTVPEEPEYRSPGLLFPPPSKEDIKKNGLFYQMVRDSEGLQDFVDLVEAKILYISCVYPANLGLLFRAMALLERLQKTQRQIFKKDDTSKLEQSLEKVFTKLKLPLGLLHDGIPDTPAA